MRAGDWAAAQQAFKDAWPVSHGDLDPVRRVWLLVRIALASVRLGDFEEGFEACAGAQQGYAHSSGIIAGNPLFHLVAGLAAHHLGEREIADDNLARTLICGGPKMFHGEDPALLARMRTILRPPAELGTWDGYEGVGLDHLDTTDGYLRELITERLGSPPPYPPPG